MSRVMDYDTGPEAPVQARQLVSVVTGTYNRRDLVMDLIDNVRQQTYRPLEHVIVADGPDDVLADMVHNRVLELSDVPITFVELGFHTSSLLSDSISAMPFITAQVMAKGSYQVWQSDDERWLKVDAISKLVGFLEECSLDFVYGQVACYWVGKPDDITIIGTNPPSKGQFSHSLYRREALDKGMLFRPFVGSGTDWDACSRAMKTKNTRWGFLREVLLSHRVDKAG